jgi:hypothetical protein
MWLVLPLVKGSCLQSLQRSRKVIVSGANLHPPRLA